MRERKEGDGRGVEVGGLEEEGERREKDEGAKSLHMYHECQPQHV